ncbi:unnamed protein product, partial [Prorocentrum cordatum]
EYVNYVLTYGGENSLKRTLTDSLELVSSINVMTDFNGGGMSFFLTIRLTPSGREHPELVLDVLYSYLAAVRRVGVDATLYASLADLMRLNWDWAQPSHGKDAVTDFAERLTQLPVDHLLSGNSRIDAPDTNVVEELLNQLRPENMNVLLVDPNATTSTAFSSNEVRVLPHYGVQYTVQDTSNVVGSGAIKRWTTWLDRTPESQIAREMNDQAGMRGLLRSPAAFWKSSLLLTSPLARRRQDTRVVPARARAGWRPTRGGRGRSLHQPIAWHRSGMCVFSRGGPSRSLFGHLAKK